MSEKIDLATLEKLASVNSKDLILGYSESGKKFGFVPVSFVTNEGYACRRWDMTKSSPVGEAVGNLDALRNLPSRLGLGCYLVDKNHGRRKLDPTNHYKFATGETAKLDGSMGDYMWGWGTKWYYAWWVEGNYYYEAADLKPIPGRMNYTIPVASTSALGVSVVDRENEELVSVVSDAAKYRGGNNDASKDGAFNTLLGRAATNLSAATFGSYARKKGEGWEAYWYAHSGIIGALFRIIFGTRNVQATYNPNKDADGLYQGGFGPGVSTFSDTVWNEKYNYYPFLPTSVGVELADGCGISNYDVRGVNGEVLASVQVPVFFGLKNFYGYLARLGRGELINKTENGGGDLYVVPKLYSTYSMTSLSGLVKAASFPAAATASTYEYIQQLSMQNLCHCPTVVGAPATSSTFYCDAFYNDNAVSGLRVPCRGGNAIIGANDGLECLTVSSAVSSALALLGSPLCEADEDWDTTPTLVPA